MTKFLSFLILASLCLNQAFAQCITLQNASFEGIENDSLPPTNWTKCNGQISTLPLSPEITLPAFAGQNYAGLNYSDNGGDSINGTIYQHLNTPLIGGTTYTITVALADIPSTNDLSANNAQCQICAGSSCSINEVLWTSPIIPTGPNNTAKWTQYTFTCRPIANQDYLILRVTTGAYVQETGHSFYVGIDSLTISCNATGIDEIALSGISLYPNPATKTVTIYSNGNLHTAFILYDLTGREIIAQECTGTSNNIDVSQLLRGCYLAKITQDSKSYSQKLIIQ